MASSKIENTGYPCVQLNWNRKKAKSVFTDLKEIANNYEWGVDEEREFYYRAISTAMTNRYWVGKGVTFFEPKQEVEPIINEYDVLVPQMNSGNNYLLTVEDATSQSTYGIRKDNLLLNQAILGFGSELATGITPTTNPVAGTPANMTDGNTATEWDSGTNQLTTHYIDIDLGASKSYIGKVRVDSSSTTDKDTTFADRFKILISADGNFAGEETQVYASTVDLGTADMVVIFVPTAGRYIRIQITQAKAAHWHVDEVEVYEWNVADITRWATEKLNERKDPVRRGVLELDICTKRIWPRGKIRVTSKDGASYYDYPHIGTKIHMGTDLKLQANLELGEMAPSIGDELLAQRRMLAEYSIAGLARDADLSSGSALQGGTITHTHIGKNSIETPMLRAGSIYAEHYYELRNTYVFSDQDSLDSSKPFEMDFEIVSEMTAIETVKLSFRIREFRAYATTVPSGGGHTTVAGGGSTSGATGSASGGGATSGATGSASGGGATSGATGSASGGGDTSGNGGATTPTSSVDSGGYASVWRILQAYNVHSVGTEEQTGWLIQDYDTLSLASHTHTHTVTLGNHTHSTPNHTHPNHTHSTPNHTHPNHTHSTPDHTHPNHQHSTPNHQHAVSNHTHSLTFGIFEDSTSPNIHYHIDNGSGYGGASASYNSDQLDLVITGSISGTGFKRIKFDSDARCRISSWVLCKIDLTA